VFSLDHGKIVLQILVRRLHHWLILPANRKTND